MAKLVVLYGSKTERVIELDTQQLVIGRGADAQLLIDNAVVSRKHCKVVLSGTYHFIVDLGSKSGTFVNGKRVDQHQLVHGDNIELGKHTLRYERSAVESGQLAGSPGAASADASSDAFWTDGLATPGAPAMTEKSTAPVAQDQASFMGAMSGNKAASGFDSTMMASGDEMKRVREALATQQSPHLAVLVKGKKELLKIEGGSFEVSHTPEADFTLPGSPFFGKRQFVIKKMGASYELRVLSWWAKVLVGGSKAKGNTPIKNGMTIEAAGLKFRVGGL